MPSTATLCAEMLESLRPAALDQEPISGLTHLFYRYPARFAPAFAKRAITLFTKPGDVVLDPFMGGATSVVEAMACGRRTVGSDINSLSLFVARAKTDLLQRGEVAALQRWADEDVPELRYADRTETSPVECGVTNLTDAQVRPVGKLLALALDRLDGLGERAERFGRCVLLNVGQWALNGRQRIPSLDELRANITATATQMLAGMAALRRAVKRRTWFKPTLLQSDAALLNVGSVGDPADLVITSPPYPGIHMLYHRWQVDGRRESNAPYWLAACRDGDGASYYCFAARDREAEDRYFARASGVFSAVRGVMKPGAALVQMVAFSEPERQLRRYLNMLAGAGFVELRAPNARRIRRLVPGRRWHANCQGRTQGSREIVLVHGVG